MAKKIIISFFLLIMVVIFGAGLCALPFILYWMIINQEKQFSFYQMPKGERGQKLLLPGKKIVFPKLDSDSYDYKYWKNFPIENYHISVPIYHPLYITSPIIHEEEFGNRLQMGVRFHNQNQRLFGEILFNESKRFHKFYQDQPLFSLPLVKGYLEKIEVNVVWKDLFTKDLSKKKLKDVFFIPPEELLYNLYILHMRSKYFPDNFTSYYFYEPLKLGGMELQVNSLELRKEVFIFMIDGILESYTLLTRREENAALLLRKRIVEFTNYSPSLMEQTKVLYGQFRDLPYEKKINSIGMMYLYAAWSHSPQDKEFLREIIRQLERGEGNLFQLSALYAHAFKHYGKEFTVDREKERIEELKEKIHEEDKKEIAQESKVKISEEKGEGVGFESNEAKMRYYLQKAKEKKKTANESKVLIFD